MLSGSLLRLGLLLAGAIAAPCDEEPPTVEEEVVEVGRTDWCGCKHSQWLEFNKRAAAVPVPVLEKRDGEDMVPWHLNGSAAIQIVVDTVVHVVGKDPDKVTDAQLDAQRFALGQMYHPAGVAFNFLEINRVKNSAWASGDDHAAMKKSLRKGKHNTLNLYIIDKFDKDGIQLGVASYATGNAKTKSEIESDAVIVIADTVFADKPRPHNRIYNLGMAAAHEIGHWMGLAHTFEGNSCSGPGDHVDDTPQQRAASVRCGDYPKEEKFVNSNGHKDSCPDKPGLDDVFNIMDYTMDRCKVGFTQGQKVRMYQHWAAIRDGSFVIDTKDEIFKKTMAAFWRENNAD